MAAVSLWRYSGGRVLGGWGPLLCVFLGSLVALLVPLVGVENQSCAALTGIAQLRCQLWEGSPQAPAVQSTSLTVPFTGLDLLPHRSKPSKGTDARVVTRRTPCSSRVHKSTSLISNLLFVSSYFLSMST